MALEWPEALEIVVARTRHGRYRALCADDHPDREHWRAEILRQAGAPPAAAAYPPAAAMVTSAIAAAGRFVASGLATVDRAEFERRRGICASCPSLDPCADRCRECGCYLAVKPWSKAEACPLGKWSPAGGGG
jgi:hypothetical protein